MKPDEAIPLNLYEVVRWGNESDDPVTGGPNGPDTCFLVRAESVEAAAQLVDRELARMPSEFVQPFASLVHLLGTERASESTPRVLRGPYVQSAYGHGWRSWNRDERDGPWIEHIPVQHITERMKALLKSGAIVRLISGAQWANLARAMLTLPAKGPLGRVKYVVRDEPAPEFFAVDWQLLAESRATTNIIEWVEIDGIGAMAEITGALQANQIAFTTTSDDRVMVRGYARGPT
ncbi:DUF6678 family protein [Roseateles violae]|uniref:Uncharacterized protein n=1 Tax=Roseateles violae TaxID=3058042 RepID=A0ABT8DQZ8_9BURK|nr:hypothetical protein [Pelomonas sp. PFR6]MDN3918722.1 hypothetical protein [Pelomonas sp. PFR6]